MFQESGKWFCMNKAFMNKVSGIFCIVAVILLSFGVSVSATEYYFSSSCGNDSNSGTNKNYAKKSFSGIDFKDGDFIYLKSADVWNECLEMNNLKNITLGIYDGEENAVFDLGWDVNEAGVFFTDCEGIDISNITVKNAGAGIVLEYKINDLFDNTEIRNCEFYSIFGRTKFDPAKETAKGNYRRSAGIEIIGNNNALLKDVKISGCKALYGDALLFVNVNDAENTLSKSVDGLLVENCYVSGSLTHGIHISGVKNGKMTACTITESRPMDYPHGITGVFLAACENFLIDSCEISYIRNFHDNPDGSGIDVEGNNENITVRNSNIHNCDGMAASVYYNNKDIKFISNSFCMNDSDSREECVIVVGDAKKVSSNILIKDNKWFQNKSENFSFIKNLNPDDEGVIEEGNIQLSDYNGEIYSENYNYFPIGGRITGMKQKGADSIVQKIDGNNTERYLSIFSKKAGQEVYKELPFLKELTLQMRTKVLAGSYLLKLGDAEFSISDDGLYYDGIKYNADDWNDISISLDAENGIYTLSVDGIKKEGKLDNFIGADSIRFIASENESDLLVDDLSVMSYITDANIKKYSKSLSTEAVDIEYNGNVKEIHGGNDDVTALVVKKILKSGVTEAAKSLDINSDSYAVGFDVSYFENSDKKIVLRSGNKDVFEISSKDNNLTAIEDGKRYELLNITEGEIYKIEIFYNHNNSLWQIIVNGNATDIYSDYKVKPDSVAFKIGEGETGSMNIYGIYLLNLDGYGMVRIDKTADSLDDIDVSSVFGKNFLGDAYIEENSVRFYNEKTTEKTDLGGEIRFEVPGELSGNVKLSFDILLENYRTINNVILYGHDDSDKERWATAMRFIFDSYGRVQYARNNTQTGAMDYAYAAALQSTSALRYEYNRFINVVYDINVDNKTFNLYIDGIAVARNAKLLNDVNDISLIGFKYTSEQRQSMRVKNMRFLKTDNLPFYDVMKLDGFDIKNNGGNVKVSRVAAGTEAGVEFNKNSSCGKVFRSYRTDEENYEAFVVSGSFIFDDIPREKTAVELLDNQGESILKLSENKGVLMLNDRAIYSHNTNDELKIMLVVYKDKYFRVMLGSEHIADGILACLPSYYRMGIDYNSFGKFVVKNPEAVYYYKNAVRLINNYCNNINADSLYNYSNIHYIGSGNGNNVNVELVR